jgi:hypothetical protein
MSINFFQIFLSAFYLFIIADAIIYAVKNRRIDKMDKKRITEIS